MGTKVYDRALHESVGDKGELAIIDFLSKKDLIVDIIRFPFGVYDVDLKIIAASGLVVYADCEVRENWRYGHFPFESVHIPLRKFDMIQNRRPFLYFVIRSDFKEMLVISDRYITKNYTEISNNKYATDETFLSVDIDNCIVVSNLDD